jgi:hypothetical protein
MAGEVLRFPTAAPRPKPAAELRGAPSFEIFGVGDAKRLLELVHEELRKSEQLFELVDHRRADAKAAGIESIAIEICALVEGGRLDAVADTLAESIGKDVPAHVSTTGMDRVRRVEKLLAEANMGLARMQPALGRPAALPSALGITGTVDAAGYLWVPLAFFGLVVVGMIAVALLSPSERRETRV